MLPWGIQGCCKCTHTQHAGTLQVLVEILKHTSDLVIAALEAPPATGAADGGRGADVRVALHRHLALCTEAKARCSLNVASLPHPIGA